MSDQPKDLPASMLQPVTFHGEDDIPYCERHDVWHASGPEHSCEAWERAVTAEDEATVARVVELEQRVADLEGWMREAVWIDPGRMQGAPCLGGHRIPVESVMSFVEGDTGSEDVALTAYPWLTREQIRLAVWYHGRYADQDRTCRWPRPVVHIDPGVNWGRPMVGGAPVGVFERVLAGEDLMDVADDYGITRRQALTACWWLGSHDDDFTDWWARWADETHTALATADDADTVCEHIPDPPAMDDAGEDEAAYRRPTEDIRVKGNLL